MTGCSAMKDVEFQSESCKIWLRSKDFLILRKISLCRIFKNWAHFYKYTITFPVQCWSQAVVWISTPRMYLQSGYFLVPFKNPSFANKQKGSLFCFGIVNKKNKCWSKASQKKIHPFASVWYGIGVLWPNIKPVKSHTTALGFRLQTDMNQIFQTRYCKFL